MILDHHPSVSPIFTWYLEPNRDIMKIVLTGTHCPLWTLLLVLLLPVNFMASFFGYIRSPMQLWWVFWRPPTRSGLPLTDLLSRTNVDVKLFLTCGFFSSPNSSFFWRFADTSSHLFFFEWVLGYVPSKTLTLKKEHNLLCQTCMLAPTWISIQVTYSKQFQFKVNLNDYKLETI